MTEPPTPIPTIPPSVVELDGAEVPPGFSLLRFADLPRPTAFAFDEDTASSIVAQSSGMTTGERTRPQLEVSASSLPRVENIDGSNRTSRIDMTWLPPRRTALGRVGGLHRSRRLEDLTAPVVRAFCSAS